MFTGIVEASGTVLGLQRGAAGAAISIAAAGVDLSDVAVGDSICVNGICLTVTALTGQTMRFDLSPETLSVTATPREGEEVNLEKALRSSDRLGGHLVTGHVDGVGEVLALSTTDGNKAVTVRFPKRLARYIAAKGSIAMQGVSLTVNSVADDAFTVNLIPHTLMVTNLKSLTVGSPVNLEVDPIARYVERMLERAE
jgi:riboflavin synthase